MWDEIQDSAGEIFDVEQFREEIAQEKREQSESEQFLDICHDLLMEGLVDEDAIEAEAHRIMDQEGQ